MKCKEKVQADRGDTQVPAPADEGGDEPHTQAPADEGGGTDLVPPDDSGDDQDGDDTGVQVPVHDEIDTDQAHDGDAHVQAPRDEGGGHVRAVDVCQDVVPAVDNEDQHEVPCDNTGGEDVPVQARRGTARVQAPHVDNAVPGIAAQDDHGGAHAQAPVDEGSGRLRAVDANHGEVPAGEREHHAWSQIQDGEDQEHGLLDGRHGQHVPADEGGNADQVPPDYRGGAQYDDSGGGDTRCVQTLADRGI